MTDHIETYRRAWGFALDEYVPCEVCGGTAVDIHHIIYRSHGGGDEFENTVALCRSCHDRCHAGTLTVEELRKAKKWPNEAQARLE
jgi:5-methylcytosine-specific restriction endonuclease McrA